MTTPEAPGRLPTPAQDWSQKMGVPGLVHAMSQALVHECWSEAAKLARSIEKLILEERS